MGEQRLLGYVVILNRGPNRSVVMGNGNLGTITHVEFSGAKARFTRFGQECSVTSEYGSKMDEQNTVP